MAQWILLNDVDVAAQQGAPAVKFFASQIINDANQPTAPIIAAGGILWPATDAVMNGIATGIAQQKKLRGTPNVSQLLLASALFAMSGGVGGGLLGPIGQTGGIMGGIQKATLPLNFNTSGMVVAATTATINVPSLGQSAPLLPANSRIVAREIRVVTPFTGGSISAMTLSLGVAGLTTSIVNAQSIFTAVGNVSGTSGADTNPFYAASTQLIATITSTSANLNVLTAGALVLDVLYTVLP